MSRAARDWAWARIGSMALTDGQKVALLWLAERSDETGHCWPTIPQIAQSTRASQRNTIRAVNQLEQLGLMAVTHSRGRGRANEYRLTCHAVTFSEPENMTNPAENMTGSHDNTAEKHDILAENMTGSHDFSAENMTSRSAQPSLDLLDPLIDQRSLDQHARRAKKKAPTWGDHADQEAFTQVEVARYAGLWTDLEVRERIDLALCHKSARNYARLDLYVMGWLRRDAESQRRTNGQHQNHPPRKPAADTGVAGWRRFRPQSETPH